MNNVLRHRQNRMREPEMSRKEKSFHPFIENVSRAISDWHSERDWFFQTDRAIRTIDAIAVELNKEGYKEAAKYLRRVLDSNEAKAKSPDLVEPVKETKFSALYF
ncbi:MAG: hypothetical protein MUP73_02665 [Dehalococcoidia bacterium]|nr:hypothetical protein [Dehalococcoidia bacterium]